MPALCDAEAQRDGGNDSDSSEFNRDPVPSAHRFDIVALRRLL